MNTIICHPQNTGTVILNSKIVVKVDNPVVSLEIYEISTLYEENRVCFYKILSSFIMCVSVCLRYVCAFAFGDCTVLIMHTSSMYFEPLVF